MAIETKKIIEISTAGAVTSVKELKDEINSLRDAWLNAEEGTEEYDKITEQLIEDQKKLNDVMRVGKNEASAATGSYNSLVNQMNALKTAWRSTTSEITRAQLGDKIREINDQLKDYDASIGNHQRKVGSYEQALQALTATYDSQKQELAALKTALDNLEPGTDAYNEAFERATEITHNLQERQQQLRMSANDLGTQLSNVASIGAGLVGAFNSVNAIMVLTGQKNEDLQKAMAKLQAGIALVQGMKGIEGAVKSMKAYAQWAAKAYDSIANWTKASSKQQKQIQATTTAAETNAKANNQVAASEGSVTVGSNTMNASLKGTAGGFSTATVAATAFKAVLMSLGIGIIVAAISALVTWLGKLGGAWLNAGKEARENTYNLAKYFDEERQKQEEKDQERFERSIELAKAQGATELEILQKYYDRYNEKHQQMVDNVKSYEDQYKEASERMRKNSPTSKITKEEKDWANKMMADILVLQEKGIDAVGVADKKMAEYFDHLKEKGVKTYQELQDVAYWFWQGEAQLADDYKFDPLGATETDYKAEAESMVQTAKDAVKSEAQAENDGYKARRDALNTYYDKISADTKTRNAGLQALANEHNHKMGEIVKAATQSIIDTAHAANQTELQNLTEKYNKEFKILKQYGKDTTELTAAYEKQKAQLVYNGEVKAIENAIKELERFASANGPMQQVYAELEAAGAAHAIDMQAAQDEQYENMKYSLERQFKYWKELWEKYQDDEKLTQDQRLALQEKYLNAKNALEKNETDYLLKQIKVRKQAIAEQIEDIQKELKFAQTSDENAQAINDLNGASGWGGFWNVFGGGSQNPSYKKQQENVNQKYDLQIDTLWQEFDVYQQIIDDMNVTDAERTAAMEKQKDLRMQIWDLETKKVEDSAKIQINKQKELISTIVDVGNSIGDILGSVADAWEANVQAQLAAGKISEQEANDQLENVRKVQITQAIINTLAGSIGAFTQASQTIPPPYGQIVGAAAAAAVLAAGYAQIAQIKAANKDSNLSSTTQMSPTMPTVSDFNPNYVTNTTGRDDTEYLNELFSKQKLFVSVTDINSTQARVKTTEQESSF